MLSYLDINRKPLMEIFEQQYNVQDYTTLSNNDQITVKFVTKTILSYIKITTCNHFKSKLQRAKITAAKALVAAKMENAQAKGAMAATDAAIKSQPLPQTSKLLKDAIKEVVDKKLANRKRTIPPTKPTANHTNNKRHKAAKNTAVDKTRSTKASSGQQHQPATHRKPTMKRTENHNTRWR
jgi:hypothetical protein